MPENEFGKAKEPVPLGPEESFGVEFTLKPPEIFPKLLPGFNPVEFEPGSNLAGGGPICGEETGSHMGTVASQLEQKTGCRKPGRSNL